MSKHPYEEWKAAWLKGEADGIDSTCKAWNAALDAVRHADKRASMVALDYLHYPPPPPTLREAAEAVTDNAWGRSKAEGAGPSHEEFERVLSKDLDKLREALVWGEEE